MTLQNIATVLGPNILKSRDDSAAMIVRHAGAVNTITLELICHAKELLKCRDDPTGKRFLDRDLDQVPE